MDNVAIRKAISADVPALLAMIRELAALEGVEQHVRVTEERLQRDGFKENAPFEFFLAEQRASPVGFVSFRISYHIWYGEPYIYIDDLFVRAHVRGKGVGRMLMQAVASDCVRRGLHMVRWTVEPGNQRAIAFYQRLGAQVQAKNICTWSKPALTASLRANVL